MAPRFAVIDQRGVTVGGLEPDCEALEGHRLARPLPPRLRSETHTGTLGCVGPTAPLPWRQVLAGQANPGFT